MKSLGVYGTGNLGQIMASLCAKVCAVLHYFQPLVWVLRLVFLFQALLASRAVVSSVRKDEHSHLAQSAEKLWLVEEISAL